MGAYKAIKGLALEKKWISPITAILAKRVANSTKKVY